MRHGQLKFCQISAGSIIAAGLSLFICLFGGCRTTSTADKQSPSNKAQPVQATREFVQNGDQDLDGIPNGAELHSFDDRENFRRWFTHLAEMQFYQLSKTWNEDQRDCAGLVRFAWREALRRHDRLWFQAMGAGFEGIAPDVRAYSLENGLLGEKLFRADFGAFQEGDLTTKFSEFADARTLKNYNTFLVSRDRRQARPGDLLFFHQPWVQKFPYHVMIFIGASRDSSEAGNDWVVYHTGASPGDRGEIKKVRLAILDRHPDRRWRPVENNRNFLGFYRLKILE